MQSEEKNIIMRVLQEYLRSGNLVDPQVKVVGLPKGKTSFVEQTGNEGRSVMLNEFRVEDKVIWAAYSTRSGTVYLSIL
jgi:hypothetical protein